MSDVDTRRNGGGQTVSYATVRLESSSLLPEQLIDLLCESARHRVESSDIAIHIEDHGTGSPSA